MQFNLKIYVFLVGLLSYCVADIDFMDCGSDNIHVDLVSIEGCETLLCYLRRGQSHNIIITPNFLDPEIDHVDLDVKAVIRGALFNVDAEFQEACGLPCPINSRVVSPHIPITMSLGSSLIRGPAPLIINATYMNGDLRRSGFCVEFDIYIW